LLSDDSFDDLLSYGHGDNLCFKKREVNNLNIDL